MLKPDKVAKLHKNCGSRKIVKALMRLSTSLNIKKESSDCIAVIEGFLSVATTYSPTW